MESREGRSEAGARRGGARSAKAGPWARLAAIAAALVASASAGCGGGSTGSTGHAISGTVSGAVSAGVTIHLSGTRSASTTTNASGAYRFAGLQDGDYTITPSREGFTFEPGSRSLTLDGADRSGNDFAAAAVPTGHSVAGVVTGAAAADVTITLRDVSTGGTRTAVTVSGGTYSFTGVANGVYVVAASRAGYAFDPASGVVTVNDGDVSGRNFTSSAVAGSTHAVSGHVAGDVRGGVLVTLQPTTTTGILAASLPSTTMTDADGAFRIDGVEDGSYSLSPSRPGFTFTPANLPVEVSGGDVADVAFTAAAAPGTHTVSGTVSGAVRAGVTVGLSRPGATTSFTATDGQGRYAFPGLEDGTYTLTPSKAGYTFSPASATAVVDGGDVTGKDFVASAPAGTYTISGTVTGAVLAGVAVSLSGSATGFTATDAEGRWSFGALRPGTYTVTPSRPGFAFNPAVATGHVEDHDVTVPAFVATAAPGGTFTISGTVSGATRAGVEVRLTGLAIGSVLTGSDGRYSFSGLADGEYTLTPVKAGFAFTPATASVEVKGADVSGKDFTAAAVAGHSISGTVTGAWVSGVTVRLTGDRSESTTTDAAGRYRFEGLPDGSYDVAASLSGYAYDPEGAVIELAGTDVRQDFAASSVVPSYSLSGTVTYAGAAEGPIHVEVYSKEGWTGETVIEKPGPFRIRGLMPGAYEVQAWMDVYGMGIPSGLVPYFVTESQGGSVIVIDRDVGGFQAVLEDPRPPSPPKKPWTVSVFPSDRSAMVLWMADIGTASSFQIWWGTDEAASNGGHATVGSRNATPIYMVSGLTDGARYYFKVVPFAGEVQGEASDVVGPVTIGAATGGHTVSGHVSLPRAATGPLYVGLFNDQTYPPQAFVRRIDDPASPQAYSISGLAEGIYECFAAADMNRNGVVDSGDLVSHGGACEDGFLEVSGNTTLDLSLSGEGAAASLSTGAWRSGAGEEYSVELLVENVSKEVVAATIVSGHMLPLPYDIGSAATHGRDFNLGATRPAAGEVYQILVTYRDGGSELLSVTMPEVIGFARNMAVNTSAPYSATAPLFTWADPVSPPSSFAYSIDLTGGDQATWHYPPDERGMPSTQHSVRYNVLEEPWVPPLTPGVTYEWSITIRDDHGNSSRQFMSYTP